MQDRTLKLAIEKLDHDRDRLVLTRRPHAAERERLETQIARIDDRLAADRGVSAKDPLDAMRIRDQIVMLERRYEVVRADLRTQIDTLEEERIHPLDKALAEVQARRRAVEKLIERNAQLRAREEQKLDQRLTDENAAFRFAQQKLAHH